MKLWMLFVAVLLTLAACSSDPGAGAPLGRWLYQLQDADPPEIEGWSGAVIDYSADGTDDAAYTQSEITGIASRGTTPLAYLSIGEAENYRFYWDPDWVETPGSNDFTDDAPDWLGRTNPDWAGNYKVRYWDEDWRVNYLEPYLDRIVGQGFQGVYLDIIDAFEYWADPSSYGDSGETVAGGDPVNDEQEAALRMIELVVWIADYCRTHSALRDRFLVFPQNGERILDYDTDGIYLETVSGIGAEDLWYDETDPQPVDEVQFRLNYLREFRAAGKQVLSVDYVDDGSGYDGGSNIDRIDNYFSECGAEGFFCYAARSDRELDRINRIPGYQP